MFQVKVYKDGSVLFTSTTPPIAPLSKGDLQFGTPSAGVEENYACLQIYDYVLELADIVAKTTCPQGKTIADVISIGFLQSWKVLEKFEVMEKSQKIQKISKVMEKFEILS